MENKNKKALIICLIAFLLILIIFVGIFLLNNEKSGMTNTSTTTTTTTTTTTKTEIKKQLYKFDDTSTGINLEYSGNDINDEDNKLIVSKAKDTRKLSNLNLVYNIDIKDKNNNVVKVDNANIKISIPYENKDDYVSFHVLYLSDADKVLDTIPAIYENGYVVFNVTHLSRYAIVGKKEEDKTSTTTTTTTKKPTTTTTTTTTKKPTTTTTTTTTKKPTTTTTTTTTKKPTTTTTTKKPTTTTTTTTTKKPTTTTTTKKPKTYSYVWGEEKDGAGQQYLYIVDESGNRVAGTVKIGYVGTDYSETINVSKNGYLTVKEIIATVSDVRVN